MKGRRLIAGIAVVAAIIALVSLLAQSDQREQPQQKNNHVVEFAADYNSEAAILEIEEAEAELPVPLDDADSSEPRDAEQSADDMDAISASEEEAIIEGEGILDKTDFSPFNASAPFSSTTNGTSVELKDARRPATPAGDPFESVPLPLPIKSIGDFLLTSPFAHSNGTPILAAIPSGRYESLRQREVAAGLCLFDSLVRTEETWRAALFKLNRPTVVFRGGDWVMKRDNETYTAAARKNGVLLLKEEKPDLSLSTNVTAKGAWVTPIANLSGIICASVLDADAECLQGRQYPLLNRFQRVSRLHGLRNVLWKKDYFCRVMREVTAGYSNTFAGTALSPFTFPCFVLPADFNELKEFAKTRAASSPKGTKMSWIVKPPHGGAGIGIYVVDSFPELQKINESGTPALVQPYMNDPYLLNGYKFDLRTYVLVTSVSPLRIHMYEEGLVRVAGQPYDPRAMTGGKKTQFLTNVSVNKQFRKLSDLVWTFSKFRKYLARAGEDPDEVFERMYEAVTKVFISAEPAFLRHFHTLSPGYKCPQCYQVLGVDVIFNAQLWPIVIEVNGSPDMHLSNQRDSEFYDAIKKSMMSDALAITFGIARTVSPVLHYELRELGVGHVKELPCNNPRRFSLDYGLRLLERDALFGERSDFEAVRAAIDQEASKLAGNKTAHAVKQLEYWQCIDDDGLGMLVVDRKEQANMGGFIRLYPSRALGNSVDIVRLLRHVAPKLPGNAAATKGTYYYHPLAMALIGAQERLAAYRGVRKQLDRLTK